MNRKNGSARYPSKQKTRCVFCSRTCHVSSLIFDSQIEFAVRADVLTDPAHYNQTIESAPKQLRGFSVRVNVYPQATAGWIGACLSVTVDPLTLDTSARTYSFENTNLLMTAVNWKNFEYVTGGFLFPPFSIFDFRFLQKIDFEGVARYKHHRQNRRRILRLPAFQLGACARIDQFSICVSHVSVSPAKSNGWVRNPLRLGDFPRPVHPPSAQHQNHQPGRWVHAHVCTHAR